MRRRCYELNPLNIPVDKAHEAKDILRNYDLIRVSEISIGLAAFFSWVSFHRYHDKYYSSISIGNDNDRRTRKISGITTKNCSIERRLFS